MRKSLVCALLLFLSSIAFGQAKEVSAQKIPVGSKVFVAPMHGDLHPFISAEIIKKKLPVVITTEEKDAFGAHQE